MPSVQLKFAISLILVSFFVCTCARAQDDGCAELQKLIDKTYNFKPSKLTAAEQTAKSAEMDVVWVKVKAEQEKHLPCLKLALKKPDANNYFVFDAANLLISIDQSDESKKILIDSYANVDLADLDLQYWMPYISQLGFDGFDTSAAGENWLKFPNPEYYQPQHGTRAVNKEIGAIIIYGSMDEETSTPALIRIISQENHPGREIAVRILMDQATPEAFRYLKEMPKKGLAETTGLKINQLLNNPKLLSAREGAPRITRQQYLDAFQDLVIGKPQRFMRLTTEVSDGEKDAVAVLKAEDIPLIRKARRFFAATANPHSAEWYRSFTDILMALVLKSEMVEHKSGSSQGL